MPDPDITYEVEVGDDGRWTLESTRPDKASAEAQAQRLVKGGGVSARVLRRKKGMFKPDVILELEAQEDPRAGTFQPLKEAPDLCASADDLYQPAQRRLIGRVFRHFLDDQGLTPTELLFSVLHLTKMERNDRLLNGAIQQVAQLQAKASGEEHGARVAFLEEAFQAIKQRAKAHGEEPELTQALQDKGLDAWLKDKGQPETLFAVTRLTREVFEPDRKLERLLALLEKVSTGQAFALVDGMIAEILDGAKALQGLLGPQRDNAGAWMTLAQLQRGKLPLKTPGPLAALNRALARDRFEETRSVLLERVSVGLAGVQPITKTGKADDKTAFQTLVKTLAEDVGISGGGAMAVAAHGRARSAFGTAEGDASAKDALIALMGLMPHKAAQLGLLLDLVTGGFETLPVLVAGFGHLLASVKRPKDLWPNDYDANVIKGAMIELRNKSEALQSQGEIGALIAQAMAKLAGDTEGETKAANAARAAAVVKKAPAKVVNRPVVRKKATDGAVIFEQGEAGETAYLIAEGTVEILIQTREGPRTIAKLGKGEVFGEMALIDNAPRMATAIAVGDCDLVTISRVDMAARLDRLEATDRVLRRLMDSFVHRLRNKA